MNKLQILLLGNRSKSSQLGNFAQAIVRAATSHTDISLETEPTEEFSPQIVIYANRTTEQLDLAIDTCVKYDIALLMLATGLESHLDRAAGRGVNIVYKPNTSKHTLDFIDDVSAFGKRQDWEIAAITEWHQTSKQDVSGTAVHIAKLLSFPTEQIQSIRDDSDAKAQYDLPSTDSYAIHKITFRNKATNANREFSLITVGRDSYAVGALDIARSILNA